MRVNREGLLKVLESISPGLAVRENIEQSSCFAFSGGRVFTFNEEVFCSRESPLEIEGAIRAKQLVELLSRMKEDEIEIQISDGEFRINGQGKKSGIRMENEVLLPIESVEDPENWRELPPEFNEGVGIVHSCASTDGSQFVLTCVHIHPEYVEACDRFQIARFPVKAGFEKPILVRGESIRKILGFDMTEVSETKTWIHFRNPAGLVISCRRFLDEYAPLDKFMDASGTESMVLPGGLEEAVSRSTIFSGENAAGNNVEVDLKKDIIIVSGEGASGWYKERSKTKYDGPDVKFLISPKLLVEVGNKSKECRVGDGRLFIDTGKFLFVTCTNLSKKKDEE